MEMMRRLVLYALFAILYYLNLSTSSSLSQSANQVCPPHDENINWIDFSNPDQNGQIHRIKFSAFGFL